MSFTRQLLLTVFILIQIAYAQTPAARKWADSVFNSLTNEQRIAQLMVVRTSTVGKDGEAVFLDAQTDSLIKIYNVGAICLFQGTSEQQAALINRVQRNAQTPVMVCVDGEWGLGMRFSDVKSFPYQLTMGAVHDAEIVYKVGKAIGEQCKRMGVHVNYAPSVDINNNPNNPIIGVRSFGENKYKVALFGSRIMQGMQDIGVMACAKHFPGHGDVDVDSHLDLPVIKKSMSQLNDLELYPFKEIFSQGIGSVMVAHLSIPAIDSVANKPTSISYNNISILMREKMGYKGLTFTDALEMQGVKKFYPDGEASVQSIIAGNDMLCLPGSVPQSIEKIKEAIASGRLTWENVYEKCKRVLLAKYEYVVGKTQEININNITNTLNKDISSLRREVAENSLTILRLQDDYFPLQLPAVLTKTESDTPLSNNKLIQYISIGFDGKDELGKILEKDSIANTVYLSYNNNAGWNKIEKMLSSYEQNGKEVHPVIALHGIARYPKNNFNIPDRAIRFIKAFERKYPSTLVMLFGNCYAAKNFCDSKNLVVCYEDDSVFHVAAADWLLGKYKAKGTLPVTVCENFKSGTGIVMRDELEKEKTVNAGAEKMVLQIDSIANNAIKQGATPGCVVTVLKNGKLVFQKAYGYQNYDSIIPVTINTIYDLASVTKISATNVAVMKLWEEGKLNLKKKISYYLPWLKGTNKESLIVENLLLHQAGMVSFIPFYKEVIGGDGKPNKKLFNSYKTDEYNIPVADALYMKNAWIDTMYNRIKTSAVTPNELKYIYSDNDFILMGDIIATISGMPIDEYVKKTFYEPLGMETTCFKPFEHFANTEIAPTENEKLFRRQLIHGYVHDPGSAMFGNVAGHAGLFSNGYDLAILYQMLLNGGTFKGKRYLKKETIDWFTSYQTPISRRGLGFDKPEKNNSILNEKAYPCRSASGQTYGHTGFTGTCVWVDPKYHLIYIFLSNRVCPSGGDNLKLGKMNVRNNIQETIYKYIL